MIDKFRKSISPKDNENYRKSGVAYKLVWSLLGCNLQTTINWISSHPNKSNFSCPKPTPSVKWNANRRCVKPLPPYGSGGAVCHGPSQTELCRELWGNRQTPTSRPLTWTPPRLSNFRSPRSPPIRWRCNALPPVSSSSSSATPPSCPPRGHGPGYSALHWWRRGGVQRNLSRSTELHLLPAELSLSHAAARRPTDSRTWRFSGPTLNSEWRDFWKKMSLVEYCNTYIKY